MPFRFKKKESVSEAIRRVGCEQIEEAIDHLDECRRAEAIHSARKNIKKARAAVRLVRSNISEDEYCRFTDLLRKSARQLAAPRDAHVKACTFSKLMKPSKGRHGSRASHDIRNQLQNSRSRKLRRFEKRNASASVQHLLSRAAKKLDKLKIGSNGWGAICPGVKKAYCEGRKSYQIVRSRTSAENIHEWRKRAKDLWYQMALLRPLWPEQIEAFACELKELGQYLGDDHDLSVLAAELKNLDEAGGGGAFEELICERQLELRTTALALGSRFYAEKPSLFCNRLRSYWHIWRGEKRSRRAAIVK